ncbi:TonB-dependent receptor [candidate division KSB1 bacterium]|nr:TonB-dependent receptor [candidate division KSB1 bacterium]
MKIIRIVTTLLLMAVFALFAGNTGKIAGTVIDKNTGEALIGTNIIIEGTNLGAMSDSDGEYFILRVPPGLVSIKASYMGYHPQTVTNIRVQVDRTIRVNFELVPAALEMPELVVRAEQDLLQSDLTATRRSVSNQEIQSTPGMENTMDIFRLQGGTIMSGAPQMINLEDGTQLQVRDESLKDIHVRGGRGGEILYMVDGVPITHPIYGGRDVLDLNVVDVQEMELITGAFSAEYGQAQSGVVNITTRSGSDIFMGGIEYKTDEMNLFGNYYETHYSSFYLGGPELFSRSILPKLGIKLPGKMNYFISGNSNLSNTPYNNRQTRDDLDVIGLKVREKQDNSLNLNGKINWGITENIETALSFHGSWKKWSRFDWMWRNYPDHMIKYSRNNLNFNFRLNHVLSKSTFYNVNFGYLLVDYRGSLDGQTPADFWTLYYDGLPYNYEDYIARFSEPPDSIRTRISAPQREPLTGFYDGQGYESVWRDDDTKTLTFKADLTSQVHREHLMKTGVEVKYNDLSYVDIQDGGVKLSNYGAFRFTRDNEFIAPPGPFPEFGQNRWVFRAFPIIGGWYMQDKFEKESLIINAGLRFDWFIAGESVNSESWKSAWENATGLQADWKKIKHKLSPRFGISFPISENTVVFFSYGHFNQLPELHYYYRDPYTGSFTGNPHLDYEQTILYEFGLTRRIGKDWAFDIKSYTKDISQQVSTTQLRAALGLPVQLHDNKGYGRARGLEFELKKRYSHFTSGKLTYTIQWANGYSSSAFDDYVRSINDFPLPIRERPLQWDIRHQIVFQGSVDVPKGKKIELFGLKLPDYWSLTVLSNFATGSPYTPGTTDPVEAQKKENTAIAPSTYNTDIKLSKSFDVDPFAVSFFLDVFNLFNQRNVSIYYGFNNWTGKPFQYGDLIMPTNQYYDYFTIFRFLDPRRFSTGRIAKAGIRIDW